MLGAQASSPAIPHYARFIETAGGDACAPKQMSTVDGQEIKRVVVRGTNWVGDSVMSVPALRALRRVLPNAHITLVLRPGVRGLFADAEFIDDLLVYDRRSLFSPFRQVREWRKRNFDVAVLFQKAC